MEREQILQQLKDSTTCPYFWTDEMWEVAKSLPVGSLSFLQQGEWLTITWTLKKSRVLHDFAVRLHPGYQDPTPAAPKKSEILRMKITERGGVLCIFVRYSGNKSELPFYISHMSAPAVSLIDGKKVRFAGYEYKDGSVGREFFVSKRVFKSMDDLEGLGMQPFDIELPVACLFKVLP